MGGSVGRALDPTARGNWWGPQTQLKANFAGAMADKEAEKKRKRQAWEQSHPAPDAMDVMMRSALLSATGTPTGVTRKSTFQTLLGSGG